MPAPCRPPGASGVRSGRGEPRLVSLALALGALLFPAVPAVASHAACLGARTTIDGTKGDDRLVGTGSRDVVGAFWGDDRVWAGAGDDLVCAGSGNDVVFDGPGKDWIDGGAGFDVVYLCDDRVPERLTGVERTLPSRDGCS